MAVNDPAAERKAVATGLSLMIIAMLIIPTLDLLAKLLTTGGGDSGWMIGEPMPALQISWARFAVQAAVVLPIALLALGWRGLLPRSPGLAALRGVLIAGATTFFFASLRFLDMTEAIAIFFVEPLILTVLSAVFLRERIGWRRISAVLVGLCGAMLIIRPNFLEIGWPALLPLGAATCFAFYLLLTKTMTRREHALTLHLWAGLAGAAAATVVLAAGSAAGLTEATPIEPNALQWTLLGALGLVAAGGHFLVVMAFRRAPASLLAPFQYLEVVAATLFGWAAFNEWPDPITWLGVAIIIGSGGFVLWRERIRAQAP